MVDAITDLSGLGLLSLKDTGSNPVLTTTILLVSTNWVSDSLRSITLKGRVPSLIIPFVVELRHRGSILSYKVTFKRTGYILY